MKRSFQLSVTLCDALVIVLMLLKPSKVSVQAVQSYREFHLTDVNGSISSPNYPKTYPKNTEWTWIIQSSQYTVVFEIEEMDLYRCYLVDPAYEDCERYDHVEISGLGFFCNGIKPAKVISYPPWKEIRITFKSLYARRQCRGNGFKASYRLVMETTTTTTTFVPTHLTDIHNTVDSSKKILEVIVPIVFGVIVTAIFLMVLTIWCCRKKSGNRHSPPGNRNARAIESRNRLLGLEIEQHTAHVGRIAQNDAIRYSDIMIRNDIINTGIATNFGPPPSYDEIGRDDNLNRSHNLEFPPSYDTVMSESTARSQESSNQAASGVEVTSDVHSNGDDAQGDPSSRLLNQLRPITINEARSRERSEVFV